MDAASSDVISAPLTLYHLPLLLVGLGSNFAPPQGPLIPSLGHGHNPSLKTKLQLHFVFCKKSLSCVELFVTPGTVAYQAPLSIGFSRQEYWSG